MSETSRDDALAWVAAVRAARQDVVARLGAGSLTLEELLAEAAARPEVGVIRLRSALESFPGARKIDTRRRLTECSLDGDMALADVDVDAVMVAFGGAS